MPIIELTTKIKANLEICFDLSRSIDFHTLSTVQTNEKAIFGRTSGLINLNETVTWEAKHFGIVQRLTSKITAFDRPNHFRDEQLKGIFKSFKHDHYFEQIDDIVLMKDVLNYQSPLGIVGKLIDRLVLTSYLTKFLTAKNGLIKEYAESTKWKLILNEENESYFRPGGPE